MTARFAIAMPGRLAGKTPEEVIAVYRAAGEAAMNTRRRPKQRKGRT